MKKVLIKVYVPMIEEEYEVWIPLNKKIHTVIGLLVKSINDFSGGHYAPDKLPELYNKATGEPYSIDVNINETDLRNSSDVILI